MKPVKKIAVLHDMCGVGKAALTNMLPILSVQGIEPCPIPTMLLSTHTGGYGKPAINKISGEYIRSCANHYKEQKITFDMIFVGYLGSPELVEAVQYFLDIFHGTTVVLDPIMGDHGKYYYNFDSSYGFAIKRLLPYADLILPNLTECYLLLDKEYMLPDTKEKIFELCYSLKELGAKDMIITSVPAGTGNKGIAILEKKQFSLLENQEVLREFHGTGDAFDGMIIAGLLNGKSILQSVKEAHTFVCECIRESSHYDYPEREGLMIEKTLNRLYKF